MRHEKRQEASFVERINKPDTGKIMSDEIPFQTLLVTGMLSIQTGQAGEGVVYGRSYNTEFAKVDIIVHRTSYIDPYRNVSDLIVTVFDLL